MSRDRSTSRSSESRPPPGGRERYDVLQEFLEQHAEAAEQYARERLAPAPTGRGRVVALVVLVAVFTVVWWKGDAWLGPTVPPKPTVTQLDAGLRTGLYLQAQRIKAYQLRTGHLPDRLDEAGPPLPGIRYEKIDKDTYRISGQNGGVTLGYRSDEPLSELLGPAVGRIGL